MSIKQKHIFSTITDDDWKHGIKAARERRKGAKNRIILAMKIQNKTTQTVAQSCVTKTNT
jgi:hypothetical protein